jgi:hypothetical protein
MVFVIVQQQRKLVICSLSSLNLIAKGFNTLLQQTMDCDLLI